MPLLVKRSICVFVARHPIHPVFISCLVGTWNGKCAILSGFVVRREVHGVTADIWRTFCKPNQPLCLSAQLHSLGEVATNRLYFHKHSTRKRWKPKVRKIWTALENIPLGLVLPPNTRRVKKYRPPSFSSGPEPEPLIFGLDSSDVINHKRYPNCPPHLATRRANLTTPPYAGGDLLKGPRRR